MAPCAALSSCRGRVRGTLPAPEMATGLGWDPRGLTMGTVVRAGAMAHLLLTLFAHPRAPVEFVLQHGVLVLHTVHELLTRRLCLD